MTTTPTSSYNHHTSRERIIIFLDVDGVLLPFPDADKSTCNAIFPDDNLFSLSQILEAFPSAELVLSSTWRSVGKLVAEILSSFQAYGAVHTKSPLRTIQAFADITDPHYHTERQHEIHKYLQDQNNDNNAAKVAAWVALDDEELVEGKVNAKHRCKFEKHVVKVNSRLGLRARDAARAIELIRMQLLNRNGQC